MLASNGIYFTAGSTLWFRDAQQEWHKFPIPASDTTPYAWGEHVVLSTDTSILDFDPKSGEVRVLASSRRNPPVTKLDGNEPLRQPTLAEWGDYGLCALVGDKLMAFDAKRQDWNVLLAATNCGESLDLHPNGAMYRSSGQCVPRMTGAVPTRLQRGGILHMGITTSSAGNPPGGNFYAPSLEQFRKLTRLREQNGL